MKKIIILLFYLPNVNVQSTMQKKDITEKGKVQFLSPETYTRFNKVWIFKTDGGDKIMIEHTLFNN